jgi:integrase
MPSLNLTDRRVKALATDQTQEEFYDTLVPGLSLRVGKGGTKAWAVRYRVNGRHRRLTLGKYPNVTLAGARERARTALADAQGGEDPATERALRRSKDTTFQALADEVLTAKAKLRPSSLQRYRQCLDADLLPEWKDRPVSSITRRDVLQLVEGIAKRAPVQANRTLATIKVVFNGGLRRGFPTLETNPAHMMEPPHAETGRDRYLDRTEIRLLWNALAHEAPVWRVMFRLAILTAQRMGNLYPLRWSDFTDADVWKIPASQFKGKRDHWVPLSPEALAVLGELRPLTGGGEFVFPGRNGARRPYVTNYSNVVVRLRERLDDFPQWSPHDFRTTFRTHATRAEKPKDKRDPAGCGVAPHIADAVLGHAEASLGFRRYTGDAPAYLLAEKRDALARWGKFVAAAVKAKGGA